MKKLLIVLLFWANTSFAQRNILPDTIPIVFVYSDTACKFDKTDMVSMYNSRCLKKEQGWLVLYINMCDILWADKQRVGNNIIIHYYNYTK